MTRMFKTIGAASTVLVVAMTAQGAQAQSNDDPAEAKAFLSSGMTLAKAVEAAEATGNGTAMAAAWEAQGSQASAAMGFEVELAKADGTVTTVVVDPANGSVSPRLAKADKGDAQDEDEDEGEDDHGSEREGDRN